MDNEVRSATLKWKWL